MGTKHGASSRDRYVIESLESRLLLASAVAAQLHYDQLPQTLTITFDGNMSQTLTANKVSLDNSTRDIPISLNTPTFSTDGKTATFTFATTTNTLGVPGVLPDGWYRVSLSTDDLPIAHDFLKDFSFRVGDTDQNGNIDGSDYARIDAAFMMQHTTGDIGGWINGDFNYNGRIDADDYALIDNAFGTHMVKPPDAPGVIVVSEMDANTMVMDWYNPFNQQQDVGSLDDPAPAPVADAGWRLQRSTDGHTWDWYTNVQDSTASEFTATDLAEGTRYFWRVRAYGPTDDFNTAYTPKVAGTTTLPGPDRGTTSVGDDGSIGVGWNNNASNGSSIRIDMSTDNINFAPAAVLDSGATSWSLSNPAPGTHYYFRVIAQNDATESMPQSFDLLTKPAAPEGFRAVRYDPYTAWATLSWQGQPGTFMYSVRYKKTNETDWSLPTSLSNPDQYGRVRNSYIVPGLVEGAHYNFELTATNDAGSAISTTMGWVALNQPDQLAVTWKSRDVAIVSWQDNSNHEDGYKILLTTNGALTDTSPAALLGVAPANAQSITLTGLAEGHQNLPGFGMPGVTSYPGTDSFKVVAFNGGGDALFYAPSVAVGHSTGHMQGLATFLSAFVGSSTNVSLSWIDSVINHTEEGWELQRSFDGVNFYHYATFPAGQQSFTDDSARPPEVFYRVYPYDDYGDIDFSNPVQIGKGVSTGGSPGSVVPTLFHVYASPAKEGSQLTTTGFTIRRFGSSLAPLTLSYSISGTAVEGEDYVALPGSVTFASGQTDAFIGVEPLSNAVVGDDKTLVLTLNNVPQAGETEDDDTTNPAADFDPADAASVNPLSATMTIVDATPQLDIDANNDSGFVPDHHGNNDEHKIQDATDKPGKIIAVDDGDSDGDGVPDFADGYGFVSTESDMKWSAGTRFVPVVLSLPDSVGLTKTTFQIQYDASSPANVTATQDPTTQAITFAPAAGSLRLWTRDGNVKRTATAFNALAFADLKSDIGYYVPTNAQFTPADWGKLAKAAGGNGSERSVTLWIEVIKPSVNLADLRITFAIDPAGGSNFAAADHARVTAAPEVSIEATTLGAFESSASPGDFAIHREGMTSSTLTINYEVGGTATPDADYESLTGSIEIPAGEDTATLTVQLLSNATIDDEYKSVDVTLTTVTISSASNEATPAIQQDLKATTQPSKSRAANVVIAQHPAGVVNPAEIGGIVYPSRFNLISYGGVIPTVRTYQLINDKAYPLSEQTFTSVQDLAATVAQQAAAGRVISTDNYDEAAASLQQGHTVQMLIASTTEDAVATTVAVNELNSVGAPGRWEGLIPFWGSARSAVHDFQTRNWTWGVINSGLAITDIALIKSVFTAGVKALVKKSLSAAEITARATIVEQVAENLSLMTAEDRAVAEAGEIAVGLRDAPAKAAYKAEKWTEYQARTIAGETAGWNYERWSNVFEANQTRAMRANQAAEAYRQRMRWADGQFTEDVEGVARRYDMGNRAMKEGLEFKTGYQTATSTGPGGIGGNLWEIARDEVMRQKNHWDIRWVFQDGASKPLLDSLDKAGIPAFDTAGSPLNHAAGLP